MQGRPTADHAARRPGQPDLALLLQGVAQNNRLAFDELYQATKAKLFGVVLSIIYNPDDASEVLQEVYLRIWHRAGGYQADKGAPMTWMIAVARHRALDWRRRMQHVVRLDDVPGLEDQPDPTPNPQQQAVADDEARRLAGCLDELEAEQRQCMVLAYREGLTHFELAERLGRPLGTIKSWIRRSLGRLRECLER
jgi:RNA polymerase sigma-70 factor (ECF subfamily)